MACPGVVRVTVNAWVDVFGASVELTETTVLISGVLLTGRP